jgi:hypothetical protein
MSGVRLGDAAVLLTGAGVVVASAMWAWNGERGETAVIRAAGTVVRQVPLDRAEMISVAGPLGPTRIEVAPGRARIAVDPSPRQLCVKQGWLNASGQAALCLPNQVSLEIRGRLSPHDTLAY